MFLPPLNPSSISAPSASEGPRAVGATAPVTAIRPRGEDVADGLAEARGGLSSDRRQQDRRLHVDPSAFKAASGRPTSTPTYTYQRGPDGRFFVIGSDGDALVVDDPAPGHGSSPAATVDPAFNRTEAAPGARTESGYPTVSLAPTPLARTAVFAYSSAARYFQATPTHLHLIV